MAQPQRPAAGRYDRRAFLRTLAGGSAGALAACQAPPPSGGAAAPARAAPSPASGPADSGDWEARWQALIEAARREGGLVVNGPPTPETRRTMPEAFTR